jgi:hypothetical protein
VIVVMMVMAAVFVMAGTTVVIMDIRLQLRRINDLPRAGFPRAPRRA